MDATSTNANDIDQQPRSDYGSDVEPRVDVEDEATEYIAIASSDSLHADMDESELDCGSMSELSISFNNDVGKENDDQPGSNGEELETTREAENGGDNTRDTTELQQYCIRPQPFLHTFIDKDLDRITPNAFVADNFVEDGQRQIILDFAMQLYNGEKAYEIHGDRFNTKAEHFKEMGEEMGKVMDAVESRSKEFAETHFDEDSPVSQKEFVRMKNLICITRDFVFTPPNSEPQQWHMDSDKGTVNVIIVEEWNADQPSRHTNLEYSCKSYR